MKDQLTSIKVNGVETEAYSYDAVGNRLSSLEHSNWSYNPGNQFLSYDGNSFGYDNNGSMTQMSGPEGTENLSYSVDDRLSLYQKGATYAQYFYDYSELRVKKVVNGERTYFIYDGSVMLAEMSYNSSNQLTDQRYYVFMAGSYYPLAMIVNESGAWNAYSFHNDHLMTPLRLTAEDESISWSADYKAFGEVTLISYDVENNLRFPGQWNDGENQLYYNHHRYYLPEVGRYNRVDPFQLDYYNPYLYTANNPIIFIDPFGGTFKTNWEFFWDWVLGRGSNYRFYDENSIQVQEMKQSRGANKLRDAFYDNHCNSTYRIDFPTGAGYFQTFPHPFSTGAQVGGFGKAIAVNNGDGTVTFIIPNVAGTDSFFYHIVPDREGTTGPMRTIYQTFQWTETIDVCKCK